MLNLEKYSSLYGYAVEKIFRNTADRCICLVRRPDGTSVVWRLYDRPVPAYEMLLETRCGQLPRVYRYIQTDDGGCLVEEEFIDGLSLTELLQGRCLDGRQTGEITRRVCLALSVLHNLGMVHRDVKTDNVLMTSDGRVALIDLDAVSPKDDSKDRDTRLLGTVGYAAPEQYGFGRSDGRADIFSVGVMMNTLLCGEHPARRLAGGTLRHSIEKCIAVNVDRRYPTVEKLMEQLPESEFKVCPQCGFHTPGDSCILCGAQVKPAPKRKRKVRYILAAVILLAVLAAGVLLGLLLGGRGVSTPAPEPSAAPVPTPTPEPTPVPMEILDYGKAPQAITSHLWGDLDGDGRDDETPYYLALFTETGSGLVRVEEDALSISADSGERVVRRYIPVVCTMEADGKLTALEGGEQALESCRMYFYRGTDCASAPDVQQLPPDEGMLLGAVEAEFDAGDTGLWVVEVQGTVRGQRILTVLPVEVTDPAEQEGEKVPVRWIMRADGIALPGAQKTELNYQTRRVSGGGKYTVHSCTALLMDGNCMRLWLDIEVPQGLTIGVDDMFLPGAGGKTSGSREIVVLDVSQDTVKRWRALNFDFYNGGTKCFTLSIPTQGVVEGLYEAAERNLQGAVGS